MIDIKLIRTNPEILDNSLVKRGLEPTSANILELDQKARLLQQSLDEKRHELNANSKQKPTPEIQAKNKQLGTDIKTIQDDYEQIQHQLHSLLSGLPNLVSEETPKGLTEEDNKITKIYQSKKEQPNQPKPHDQILAGLLDKEAGVRIAGSRFHLMQGKLAKLARTLAFWLIEMNVQAGYQEVQVPQLMNADIAYGMGVLPKFAEDLFETTTGHYLIPTAEAALVGMYQKQKLDKLPCLMTCLSHCYRSEAGSAGKDTAGLIRMHQFQKVEIVGFVEPEQVDFEHNRLVEHVEFLLQELGLSYRILAMCAGDLGFHAHKKFDLEVWMPGMNRFLEISSCSQCSDFQSRRLSVKNKPLPHTINGSALPIERTLAAIVETYQNGTDFDIPDILKPYW